MTTPWRREIAVLQVDLGADRPIAGERQRVSTDRLQDVLVLRHPLLEGTRFATTGIPDAFASEMASPLSERGRSEVGRAVEDVARRIRRNAMRERALARGLEWSEGAPPGWTLLAHPVAILRERTAGAAAPGDVRIVQDLVVGRFRIDRANADLHVDDGGAVVVAGGGIPLTIAAAMAGRPLSAAIAMPETGDAALDEALASVRIASVRCGDGVTLLVLEPVRWLPFEPVPAVMEDAAPRRDDVFMC